MQSYEDGALKDVLEYYGSDMNVLRSKQMSARIMRETRTLLNQHIREAIEAARDVLLNEVSTK